MKRWYKMLIAAAIALAAVGIALTVTTGANRESIARWAIGGSMAAMLACALLRPKAARAETAAEAYGRVDPTRQTCTFQNVAANDEARESLIQLSEYLKNQEKYAQMGARMPKGVLLFGPPGTG